MNLKVLGPGCSRCCQLAKTTREVVKELGIDTSIEEVKDINEIIACQILTTPGLVLNGQVVCSGRVPTKAEISQFITAALAKEEKSTK